MTLKFILVTLLTIGLMGCGGDDKPKKPSFEWDILYSPGMPKGFTGSFDFPVEKNPSRCVNKKHTCNSVHYVLKDWTKKPTKSVTMNYVVSAPKVTSWNYKLEPTNTCNSPAKVSFMLYKSMQGDNGRFWSKDGSTLKHGKGRLHVEWKRENWINVWGKTPSEAAWKNFKPTKIGMTFGGGCFKGHGVNVTGGPAKFTIKGYAVK